MVDTFTLSMCLAFSLLFWIPGWMKISEIAYEMFLFKRGFIRVLFSYPNGQLRQFFTKPKNGNVEIEGMSYQFSDNPRQIARMGSMATILVDSKSHEQIILRTERREGDVEPARRENVVRISFFLGLKEGLKKALDINKYMMLLAGVGVITLLAVLFIATKVANLGAAA